MSVWSIGLLCWIALLAGFLLGTLWCAHRIDQYQAIICKLYEGLLKLGSNPLED